MDNAEPCLLFTGTAHDHDSERTLVMCMHTTISNIMVLILEKFGLLSATSYIDTCASLNSFYT